MLSAVKSRPPEVLRAGVRQLFLVEEADRRELGMGLVFNCSQLTHLEIWLGPAGVTPYLPALSKLRLQSLALMSLPDNQLPLTHPLFLSVTYLDILPASEVPGVWADWSHLAALPALTHLCLGKEILGAILPQLVVQCPRLVVISTAIFSASQADLFADNLPVNDVRVVVRIILDYVVDWETGARSGVDFWVRAERFITRKRRGEIYSASSCSLFRFGRC